MKHHYSFVPAFALAIGLVFCQAGYAGSLEIEDFTFQSKLSHHTDELIYEQIFNRRIKTDSDHYSLRLQHMQGQNITSSSFTSKLLQEQAVTQNSKTIAKYVWKTVLYELRDRLKEELLPSPPKKQKGNQPLIVKSLAQSMLFINQDPANKFLPRLKVGKDHVKPGFVVKNSLNTHVDIGTSYHTGDKLIETKLSKKVSQNIHISMEHTHSFDDEIAQQVLFGVGLRF